MMDLTAASLVQLARHFYPTGYPVTTDEYSEEGLLPYQRTPEHTRWREAWDKAMAWPEWNALKVELRRAFGTSYADSTHPWVAACRKCCVYLERPLSNGARHVTRVAAAASVLAPLYIVYSTTTVVADKRREEEHLFLEVPEEVKPQAAILATLVERVLGYQAFPLQFASVPVPGIRVGHTHGEEATLLDALFDNHLQSLF